MNEHIEKIREAVIKAHGDSPRRPTDGREIRLSDVLLAIEEGYIKKHGSIDDALQTDFSDVLSDWNLRADSLTDQSPETIEFIAGLLA